MMVQLDQAPPPSPGTNYESLAGSWIAVEKIRERLEITPQADMVCA